MLTIKTYIRAIFRHHVARNAFALSVMQVANFMVPLMVLPYLTRTIGIDAFGVVMFTLATIQLAYVVTDYGFSLYATYEISRDRENIVAINNLIGTIFTAKVFLALVAGVGVYFASLISDYAQYGNIFLFAVFAVVAQAFQPIWLFQGIERMKHIAIYMVISKLIYLGLVLVFVKNSQDTQWVILAWSVAQGIGSVIAIRFIYREGYAISIPSFSSVIEILRGASGFFWSRIAVAVYTSANTVVLGLVGNSTQLAFYGACDQLYKAGQNVTGPINQALYPYMAKEKDWNLFFRIVGVVTIVLGLSVFMLSFFIGDILSFIFGQEFAEASSIMIVLLLLIVVNYIGVTFGYPAFGAVGIPTYANFTVIVGAFGHLFFVLVLYMTGQLNAFMVASTTLLTESIVMLFRVVKIMKLYKLSKIS